MAAKLLNLFDFYWFQHLIFSNKPPPPSPPPPAPHPDLQFYDPFKESNLSEHLPTLHVRSLGDADQFFSSQESFTLDNSVSPSSVLQASKLQRIFSAKELGEGYPTFDETDRPIERKVYGGRRRKGSRKSLSELELEEVKGFMDLGFVFSEEDKNSWLVSIVPGLKRLGRKSTSGGEDHDEEEDGENIEKSEVSRPYLSEAWAVLDRRRKEMDGLLNWRIPASANEMDMKDHLRLWAHTVASAVRSNSVFFKTREPTPDTQEHSTMASSHKEELLTETRNRFVLFPIKYPRIWQMYKMAVASFWTAEEADLSKDHVDWEKLSDNERFFVKNVLAFFAASDGIVMENLGARFSNEIPVPEVRAFYAFQNAIEAIHSETYSLLIDTYINDTEEKAHLFDAIHTIPCIKKKADWALKWIESKDASFPMRLMAFACVEGIFFSGAFCAIFWLKERGVLPGLCFTNELISRDESLHTEFAVLLYSMLQNKLPREDIVALFTEAVEIEKEFITESIPCKMLGMNSDLMAQYIQYVADRLLLQLGYDTIWNVQNPFDFMERISISNKTNFFEGRVAEYSMAKVQVPTSCSQSGTAKVSDGFVVNTDEDF